MRLRITLLALTALSLAACQSEGGGGGRETQSERPGVSPNQLRSVGVATPSVSSPKHPHATPSVRGGIPLAPNPQSRREERR